MLGKVTSALSNPGTAAIAGGAAIAAGIAVGTKALYDLGKSFDDAYDSIQKATGASGKRMDEFRQAFRDTLQSVPDSMGAVTSAVSQTASAWPGITGKALSELSTQFLDLANVTGVDLKTAIDGATQLFKFFGIDAKDAAGQLDFMFKVAKASGLNFGDLLTSLNDGKSLFRDFGIGLDDATKLLGSLKAQGVDAADIFPALKKGLSSIVQPNAAMVKDFESGRLSFKDFAAQGDNLQGKFGVITGRIQDLAKTGHVPEALALAYDVFGKKAGASIAAVYGGANNKQIEDFNKRLADQKNGIHDTRLETEDFSEKWARFGNRAKVALEPLASAVFDFVNVMSEKLIPVLEAVMGFFLKHKQIFMVLGIAIGAIIAIIVILGAVMLAWIVAPTVAVITIIGLLWENWDTIWNLIWNLVLTVWDGIQVVFWAIVGFFTDTIPGAFFAFWDAAQSVFWSFLDFIGGIPGTVFGFLGDLVGTLYQKGLDLIQGLWNGAVDLAVGYYSWIGGIALSVLQWIGDTLGTLYSKGVDILQGLWNGAVDKFGEVVNWFAGVPSAIWGAINDAMWIILDIGSAIVSGIKDGISNAWDAFIKWVLDKIGSILDKIKEFLHISSPSKVFADEVGANIMLGLKQGIEDNTQPVIDAMTNAASQVAAVPFSAGSPDMSAGGGPFAAGVPVGVPAPDAVAGVGDQSLAAQQAWQTQSTQALTDATNQQLGIQQLYGASAVQSTADTQALLNGVWTAGLDQTVTTTDAYWSLLNANTLNQFGLLQGSVTDTMSNVVGTMATGASTAADYFVAALAARIPPIDATLSQYSADTIAYGRQYLAAIGAPVPFAAGGIFGEDHTAHIATQVRMFGEPETGGEAYIPLAQTKRTRSLDLTRRVAGMFGFGLTPFADGGFSLPELFWENASGTDWKNGVDIGRTIGGHADHTHAAISDGHQWPELDAYLAAQGVPFGGGSTTRAGDSGYHGRGQAKDYGTALNGGIPGVDAIYQAFLKIIGGGGAGGPSALSLPMPDVPVPPDFGPGTPAYQATVMALFMHGGMAKVLTDARQKIIDSMGAGGTGASVPESGPYKEYAKALFPSHGWDVSSQFPPLDSLWNKESNWSPTASNGTYYGIPQGPIGILSQMDPYAQIRWGEDYITGRYGSPGAAWGHSQQLNWYKLGAILSGNSAKIADNGTRLDPGWNSVFNGTGGMETLHRDGGRAPVHIDVHPSEGMDEAALAKKVRKEFEAIRDEEAFGAGSVR